MKFSFLPAIVLVAGLSACVVTEPSTLQDVHTGVQAGVSREFVASKNVHRIVRVQAMAGTASGQRGYLLKVRRNASFSNNAFFYQAYSYGRQLPYKYEGAKVNYCSAIGCDVVEWGYVTLDAEIFNQGLRNGMQLKLIGRHDTAVLNVPAAAFIEAQRAMPR